MDTQRRESLTRKHLAERRRRAKINHYLDEIEALISPPGGQANQVKMEKAELLEKTVEYLKAVRSKSQQLQQQILHHQYLGLPMDSNGQHMNFQSYNNGATYVTFLPNVSPLNLSTSPTMHQVQSEEPEVENPKKRSRSRSPECKREIIYESDSTSVPSNDNIGNGLRENGDSQHILTESEIKKEVDGQCVYSDLTTRDIPVWRPWKLG